MQQRFGIALLVTAVSVLGMHCAVDVDGFSELEQSSEASREPLTDEQVKMCVIKLGSCSMDCNVFHGGIPCLNDCIKAYHLCMHPPALSPERTVAEPSPLAAGLIWTVDALVTLEQSHPHAAQAVLEAMASLPPEQFISVIETFGTMDEVARDGFREQWQSADAAGVPFPIVANTAMLEQSGAVVPSNAPITVTPSSHVLWVVGVGVGIVVVAVAVLACVAWCTATAVGVAAGAGIAAIVVGLRSLSPRHADSSMASWHNFANEAQSLVYTWAQPGGGGGGEIGDRPLLM